MTAAYDSGYTTVAAARREYEAADQRERDRQDRELPSSPHPNGALCRRIDMAIDTLGALARQVDALTAEIERNTRLLERLQPREPLHVVRRDAITDELLDLLRDVGPDDAPTLLVMLRQWRAVQS